MITPRKIIGNELMKEIISIRVDTLWRMLRQKQDGFFPDSFEEGATGKFDNKGAIFIPGGLIYQDVDEMPISYEPYGQITPAAFRQKVRRAMRYDNATLLYPDGMATGINLDGGFFSKAARRIYTYKKAAFRRKKKIGSHTHLNFHSDDIILSHCPTYMPQPYGARTRISTCAAVGLTDPPLFFSYCETQFNLYDHQAETFAQRLDGAQDPVTDANGSVLFPPYIIVCHDTRYKDNSLTGLTRILGIGKFGEFATFSFEEVNKTLSGELKRKNQQFAPDDVLATFDGNPILGILRIYAQTNPGRRSKRYALHIVSPAKDLDLNIDRIEQQARQRYQLTAT